MTQKENDCKLRELTFYYKVRFISFYYDHENKLF